MELAEPATIHPQRPATIRSLSAGGLFLQTAEAASSWVGNILDVALRLRQAGPEPLVTRVEVCWVDPRGAGGRFRSLTGAQQEVLLAALRDHLIEQLEPQLRLLIVDDDPAVLRAFARALRRELAVIPAESPARALEVAREQRFDFVLCDIGMRGMDGFALRDRLTALRPELAGRILFMSGGAHPRTGKRDVPILPKPVRIPDLLHALRALADNNAVNEG